MASFENLVALANYEERLREARKIVWRDRGERPVELEDLWECIEHAGRGGLRAGGLAFAIRSGVNLFLLLTRIKRVPQHLRFALIRHAIFGEDSLRFGAMLGSFVAIYKFILNALPILLPGPKSPPKATTVHTHSRTRSQFRSEFIIPSVSASPFADDDEEMVLPRGKPLAERRARLSMSALAHQEWVSKTTRRWYSVLAGAIAGGIAITFEKRGRRAGIAQQMFVRGLQGSYNTFSKKHGIRIPHGDVLIFALSCGQIMYSFFLRQDTLPRSYVNWIQKAAMVSTECVSINRDLVREGFFKLSDVDAILARTDFTAPNRTDLLARRALAALPTPSYGPRFVPCSAVHPWYTSCVPVSLERFVSVFRWMFPIYGALHFIPMVLFKRATFWKDPAKMLLRAGMGTARSSAFLGVFVVIYQALFCAGHNAYLYLAALRSPKSRAFLSRLAKLLPQSVMEFFVSKPFHWLLGSLCGLALFVEEKRRREELAMYVLPKALESAWVMARGKGLVFRTGESGEMMLTAIGMGMVMSIYQNDPQHLSGLVRRILYQFVGPN